MARWSTVCAVNPRRQLDEASLIPFADDPEVARRVELATGKQIHAVAAEQARPAGAIWICETAPLIWRATAYDYSAADWVR